MRNVWTLLEPLTPEQLDRIINVVEKGLEVERLEQLANRDPDSRARISDTSVFLGVLYFRKVNGPAGDD